MTIEKKVAKQAGVLCVALLTVIVGMALALAGCATTPIKGSSAQVGDHQTISGLVRVAQMNVECDGQETLLKSVISDAMVSAGAPMPDKITIRALSGSSLCGVAQGMGDELGTPDLGARYLVVAEVVLYWSNIDHDELQKAYAVLTAMRPIPAK